MAITNTKQDFERAETIAREYSDSIGQMYLIHSYEIKKEFAENGDVFDHDRFDTAFRAMIETAVEKEA